MKVTDKIAEWKSIHKNRPWVSLEVFPPKTEEGTANLTARLSRFARFHPLWVNVTWGAGGGTRATTMTVCSACLDVGLDPMMHLTCTGTTKDKLIEILTEAKRRGIQNIFALRGDPPKGSTTRPGAGENELTSSADLVTLIRENFGDYFCVGVAGYPEKHPESASLEENAEFLKRKVDAGADIIFTQFFQENSKFEEFVKLSRSIGVTVPILPGILPIMNYDNFKRFTGMCGTTIPDHVNEGLEKVKHNEELVKKFGVQVAIQMSADLLTRNVCEGIHLYTMNTEGSATDIIEGLGIVPVHVAMRVSPWKKQVNNYRKEEGVRPVHWTFRGLSYVNRTRAWSSFPKNQWQVETTAGEASTSASPANEATRPSSEMNSPDCHKAVCTGGDFPKFAPFSVSSISFAIPKDTDGSRRKIAWGESITCEEDVMRVFYSYVRSAVSSHMGLPPPKTEVLYLPWRPNPFPIHDIDMVNHLVSMSSMGLCLINWQQNVKNRISQCPCYGWGKKDGFVSQRGYLEFFVSPAIWEVVKSELDRKVTNGEINVTYFAGQNEKPVEVCPSSARDTDVCLCWGSFGEEKLNPVMTNADCFAAWKEEAFSLWSSEWASIYKAPSEESSKTFVEGIKDSWYLVSVIENDYEGATLHNAMADIAESLRFKGTIDHPKITGALLPIL